MFNVANFCVAFNFDALKQNLFDFGFGFEGGDEGFELCGEVKIGGHLVFEFVAQFGLALFFGGICFGFGEDAFYAFGLEFGADGGEKLFEFVVGGFADRFGSILEGFFTDFFGGFGADQGGDAGGDRGEGDGFHEAV